MNKSIGALNIQKLGQFFKKHGRDVTRQEHVQIVREALQELGLEPTVDLCAQCGIPPHYFLGPGSVQGGIENPPPRSNG